MTGHPWILALLTPLLLSGCRTSVSAASPPVRAVGPAPLLATIAPSPEDVRADARLTRRACRRAAWSPSARLRSALVAPVMMAGVAAYGVVQWDYGSSGFGFADEGWFGHDTEFGGADKLGHSVASHIFTSGVSQVHRHWGFNRRESARRGALIAFSVLAAMEVGDGFSSEHGFSWEDLVFDAAGCVFGYFHEVSPRFAEIFDLRWEFWPSSKSLANDDFDAVTAYEDSAFVLAANVGALFRERRIPLDLLDLQVGYRVRDIALGPRERRQELLLGVGLNLANLGRRLGLGRYCRVFEYYQVPWLNLRLGIDLNG